MALAVEQRSNMAIVERAGFEMDEACMAGDYSRERCQLVSIKANPATDEHGDKDLQSQNASIEFF